MSSKRNKRPDTTDRPKLAPVPQPKTEVLAVKADPISGYDPPSAERVARLTISTTQGVYLGLVVNEDLSVVSDEDLEYDDDEVEEFDSDVGDAQEELFATCSTVDGQPLDLDGELALRTLVVAQRALSSLRARALARVTVDNEYAVAVLMSTLSVASAQAAASEAE
jgi:hypothetical protein